MNDPFGVYKVSKAYDKKRGKEGAKYGAKAGATIGGAAGVAAGGLQAADYVSDRRGIGRWSTGDGRAIINGRMPNAKAATLIARHAGKQGAKGALVGGAALGALGAGAGFKKKKKVSKAFSDKKKFPNKEKASAGRRLTGIMFPGVHGAVAGKKGKKLKAAGNELGGYAAGTAAGIGMQQATRPALLSAAQKGSPKKVAAILGGTTVASSAAGIGATDYGVRRAQAKGHFKKLSKDKYKK